MATTTIRQSFPASALAGARTCASALALALVCGAAAAASALPAAGATPPARTAGAIRHDNFFVGGRYIANAAGGQVMQGQMYVEALLPARPRHRWPLVLVHGGAQTATNFLTTPDGRKGWAQWFAEQGWPVYLVDAPARGRSAWQEGINGKLSPAPAADRASRVFTAPENFNDYPQARLHTQWPGGPGKGVPGEPVFDQFYASQVPYLGRGEEGETLMRDALLALLDRIGPALLVVHSQGGLYGWSVTDARPAQVKGLVAIEPNGPPFVELSAAAPGAVTRPYGLTTVPLHFVPAVTAESPFEFERQATPDRPDLVACWVQKGTHRKLPNFTGVPVLMVTSEASYHAPYDHCTARFLDDAGVQHDYLHLADVGIHGNGHMMMIERNNLQVAAALNRWLVKVR